MRLGERTEAGEALSLPELGLKDSRGTTNSSESSVTMEFIAELGFEKRVALMAAAEKRGNERVLGLGSRERCRGGGGLSMRLVQ